MSQRHRYLNDLTWRAMWAGIPSVKQPQGSTRSDGKRPYGFTLIPWREGPGRNATWDVTVTVAATLFIDFISLRSICGRAAAQRKIDKYEEVSRHHRFFPIASETLGPRNRDGHDFLSELGHRISAITMWSARNKFSMPTYFYCCSTFQCCVLLQFVQLRTYWLNRCTPRYCLFTFSRT